MKVVILMLTAAATVFVWVVAFHAQTFASMTSFFMLATAISTFTGWQVGRLCKSLIMWRRRQVRNKLAYVSNL